MKKLILMFLLIIQFQGFGQYRNQISTFTTKDFNHKPASLLVYVGITNNIKDNSRILKKVLALLPKEIKVRKAMIYNDTWIESESRMILSESISSGSESALIITALDSEDKQKYIGFSLDRSFSLFEYTERKYKYEMRLQYAQTELLLWRGVTLLTNEDFPTKRMINYAIGEGVL